MNMKSPHLSCLGILTLEHFHYCGPHSTCLAHVRQDARKSPAVGTGLANLLEDLLLSYSPQSNSHKRPAFQRTLASSWSQSSLSNFTTMPQTRAASIPCILIVHSNYKLLLRTVRTLLVVKATACNGSSSAGQRSPVLATNIGRLMRAPQMAKCRQAMMFLFK